jgi:hypothetical protein
MSTPKTFSPSIAIPVGVHGTAVFSATGGQIGNLTVTGCVKNVTYNSVGQYTVELQNPPINYNVQVTLGDDSNLVFPLLTPVESYTPSGFNLAVTTITALYDAGLVFILIP